MDVAGAAEDSRNDARKRVRGAASPVEYAAMNDSGPPMDLLTLARQDSAGMVIRGSYYLSGDSVLVQAGIMDVASGRTLRSFDPVGAPVERAMGARDRSWKTASSVAGLPESGREVEEVTTTAKHGCVGVIT